MELKGKKVLIVGAGVTGQAVARFLVQEGAQITLNDRHPDPGTISLSDPSISCVWGDHPEDLFLSMDLIVLSPGVPLHLPAVQAAKSRGVPVVGELELLNQVPTPPIMAITGTNGKTTTTTFAGEILRNAGLNTFVGGNIGRPAIELCTAKHHYDWAVLEVSSFQLATAPHFHPTIGAILNIEPDHLDWHPTLEDYVRSKWAITRNMNRDDFLILYAPLRSRQPADLNCAVHTFSESDNPVHAAYIHQDTLIWQLPDMALTLPIRDLSVSHPPLLLDMLAAGLLAHAAGVPVEIIGESLRSFRGLPHRLEAVGTIDGIRYINDSKATNVDAVKWALKSVDGPIVWLAGGLWKGGDLSVLSPEVRSKVRALVAFGRDANLFETTFRDLTRAERVSTLSEAVDTASRLAEPGDTVLLSPACASFDQFQNYKERGEVFASLVAALASKTDEEKTHALA